MNDPAPNLPTSDLLLQHVGWTRALASTLVRDADLADDLAQETLRVALERPPAEGVQVRSWLGTVMRNVFREHVRSRENRRAREATSARPEAQVPSEHLVQHLHTQRLLADVLLELDEPFRGTLLLRYYEDLPPRAIARRQGVPVATVKSRLARGLARLRERLDAQHGGSRATWVLAFAPLVRDVSPAALAGVGGLIVNTKIAVAAGLALAAAGAWVLFGRTDAAPTPAPGAELGALQPDADRAAPLVDAPPGAGEDVEDDAGTRLARGADERVAPAEEVPSTEVTLIRGRVLDGDGLPVAGLSVRLRGSDETTLTRSGGDFELPTTAERGSLEVADEAWVMVRVGSWSRGAALEPVLVVAPAIDLSGHVVDDWGRGLESARVALLLPADFGSRFGAALDASFQEEWTTRSDAEGRFALRRAPAVSGGTLRAVHDRYAPGFTDAPTETAVDLLLELRSPLVPDARALRGVVLRADGAPADAAHVALGLTTVRTDELGRFVIDTARTGDARKLTAVEAGSLPGTFTSEDGDWSDFVELRLGPPCLTIRGRVVDERGAPLAGGRVWVDDATPFGVIGKVPVRLEALMAGGRVPPEALDSLAHEGPDFGSARPVLAPDALLYWVRSDEDGAFELPGLADRNYTLNVLDEGVHWAAQSERIAAGATGVELVVRSADNHATLAGRVLTEAGDPLPGVSISPFLFAFSAEQYVIGGTTSVTRFVVGKAAVTDAEGRFTLAGVPRQHVRFHILSEDIVPTYASIEDVRDPANFEVRVLARVHLEVDVGPTSTADRFRVTDAEGETVSILEMRADGYSTHDEFALTNGRSGIVTITSDAATLSLLQGDTVLESIPITPRPGQPHSVTR